MYITTRFNDYDNDFLKWTCTESVIMQIGDAKELGLNPNTWPSHSSALTFFCWVCPNQDSTLTTQIPVLSVSSLLPLPVFGPYKVRVIMKKNCACGKNFCIPFPFGNLPFFAFLLWRRDSRDTFLNSFNPFKETSKMVSVWKQSWYQMWCSLGVRMGIGCGVCWYECVVGDYGRVIAKCRNRRRNSATTFLFC